MKIFSSHRKKLEPKRRFGGQSFRNKVKKAANYKRVFSIQRPGRMQKFWQAIGLGSRMWRWGGLILLLVIVYFFVLSSQFVIADVQVEGNAQISTQQIQDAVSEYGQSRLFLVKRADYFLMNRGGVEKTLVSKIPTIKEITSFKKIWPNKLQIRVAERTPGFILKSSDKYFLVDDEGVIIKQVETPGPLLVVEDSVVEAFATSESLPNPKTAPFIVTMSRAWSSKISSGITTVKFPGKAADQIGFTSSEGWTVLFDLNRSATSELNSLALILSKQIPAKDRPNLAYIDLRLSKWAYYCYKATACEQQPQTNPGDTPSAQ